MTQKETRMRCIEALATMGSQTPSTLIARAIELEKWVSAADDKVNTPSKPKPK